MDEIKHSPLSQREHVISADVADAIEALVERDVKDSPLPKAYTIADVVDMLILMVHLDNDGTVKEITPAARRAFTNEYGNRLQNSSVFQAGYKRYEKRTEYPVVPATTFFFANEFCSGGNGVDKTLDKMSDMEVRQSLPKRPSQTLSDLSDENSELIPSGAIAGVVIFPQNSRANLLGYWLKRRAANAEGQMGSAVAALEHARPQAAAVGTLKAHAKAANTAMARALPKPKKEEKEEDSGI
jgi:hypothetical protein